MAQSTITGDVYVTGSLNAGSNRPSAGSVADAQVAAFAGTTTGIQADKLQHRAQKEYADESATLATSQARVIHVVRGIAGTVKDFYAGAVVPLVAPATTTVDLLKNGTTMLTAPISLAAADLAYAVKIGTLASTALVAGDVLEVRIVVGGAGTKPKGVIARLTLNEDPS